MSLALLYLAAAALVAMGLAGTIVPALPGPPLVFFGLLLAAWADGFAHVGAFTLSLLALLTVFALILDFIAGLAGARRVGASRAALVGAVAGTLAGLFFGLPGLLLGPFLGALGGELLAGSTLARATGVGAGAWIGFLVGSVVKIAVCIAMLGLFAGAWLLA